MKTGFILITTSSQYGMTVDDWFYATEDEAKNKAQQSATNYHKFESDLKWDESNAHGKVLACSIPSRFEGTVKFQIIELMVREAASKI